MRKYFQCQTTSIHTWYGMGDRGYSKHSVKKYRLRTIIESINTYRH